MDMGWGLGWSIVAPLNSGLERIDVDLIISSRKGGSFPREGLALGQLGIHPNSITARP